MAQKKITSQTKSILTAMFIVSVLVGLIIYMLNADGIETIKNIIQTADYRWILVGLFCVAIEWIFEAESLHIPLKKMYPKLKYGITLKTNIIGRFFNNVTPFSSGGQPFQAYILKRYGLRVSDTFSVLMVKFVVYQIALFTWAILLLIVNFDFFNATFKDYMWFVLLGFFMNLIAVLFVIIAGINKKLVLKVVNPIVKLIAKIKIGKIKIIKDLDSALKKVDESVSNYSSRFTSMKGQLKTLVKMYIITLVQLLAYFSIPFMIYKAFGNVGVNYLQILTVQAFLLLVMSFIPTPGSELGAEGGFALLYGTIFTNGLTMAILFWRTYTYYIPIIIGVAILLSMGRNNIRFKTREEIEEEIKET